MTFRLKKGEFFTGLVCNPGQDESRVVVERGSRVAVVKRTVIEAGCINWDWVIELHRETGDEDNPIEVIKHWSSVNGELPPVDRPANF